LSANRDLSGKVIVVSGAAGFIPGHLCEFYLAQGATIYGLDNFLTGRRARIEELRKHEHFHFIEQDVSKPLDSWSSTIPRADWVYHLASPASPLDFEKIPLEIIDVNTNGTRNMLELARIHQARFLLASTSEVYGDPEIHPQTENYFGRVNCTGPRAPYDESKRLAEAMTMTFRRNFELDTRIVRIFNTYGPGMRANDGRVIPNFVNQALRGDDITVFGEGEQSRSFCYVLDLVAAMDTVMNSQESTPVNIGNTEEYSIIGVAQKIIELTKSKSQIVYRPLPKDDPTQRRPDLGKLFSLGDFRPSIDLEKGLTHTIEYFQRLATTD
jgi:dTDP-glucose 4,6-dehydratase